MRSVALALCIFALAACDSGTVPSPAEQARLKPGLPDVAEDEVLLRADGITAGTDAFYFAAGQTEVEAALARTLGDASETGELGECGAGAMDFAKFPDGLTVNFQNGSLVGWYWDEPSEKLELTNEINVGDPRAEIEGERGYSPIEDSTLGEEFAIGDRIGGFIADDAVSSLYAGTQCFFR
ncbi:aspartate-semialdehyde dehydrogenase [Erythrobacter sp. MTPC3]|uniref:aspartate-semialdehyde dehydrogenase n=1 Tax=Erythrobacter sp. MTPC3 TaxID=3056564 RepID=UPI0036F29457